MKTKINASGQVVRIVKRGDLAPQQLLKTMVAINQDPSVEETDIRAGAIEDVEIFPAPSPEATIIHIDYGGNSRLITTLAHLQAIEDQPNWRDIQEFDNNCWTDKIEAMEGY